MKSLRLTIRNSLIALVSILSVCLIMVSGEGAFDAYENFGEAQQIATSTRTSDLLLTSAGAWALERGLTNTALATPDPVSQETRDAIAERRSSGDAAFEEAVDRISNGRAFGERQTLLDQMAATRGKVGALRAQADAALGQPRAQRPQDLIDGWVPAMTDMILASQRLREGAKFVGDSTASQIALVEAARGEMWAMSEFAGRERALIGATLANNAAIDTARLQQLATYRGRVEQAWFNVEAYLRRDHVPAALETAANAVRTEFFGTFEQARKAIYMAGTTGQPYPMTSADWIKQSTAAINTLLALASATVGVAGEITDAETVEAEIYLAVSSALLLLGVALAVAALWITLRRVISPLRHITSTMTELAGGNLTTDVPFAERKDEVGEMAAAVQVFKNSSIRVAALAEQEIASNRESRRRADVLQSFQTEFEGIIADAAEGRFDKRVAARYADDDINRLATDFNSMLDTINSALSDAGRVLSAMAKTDLTKRMQGNYRGVFAQLRDDTNKVGDTLTDLVGRLRNTSRSLRIATGEILAGANDLSERTTRQAATIEQTSATMEQLANTIGDNANKAETGAHHTRSAAALAEEGRTVMDSATSAMDRITQSSDRISSVIGLIDDIAFQTNLLALNASVEAARAGELGKGFAVVAVEVRRLAQSAAQASSEVKQLIEQSGHEVQDGSRLVSSAATKLAAILDAVNNNTSLIAEIAGASSNQSGSIREVTTAVRQLDEMTQHNAALVEQTNAAIEQTEAQAVELDSIVAIFQIIEAAGRAEAAATPAPQRKERTTSAPAARAYLQDGNAAVSEDWTAF